MLVLASLLRCVAWAEGTDVPAGNDFMTLFRVIAGLGVGVLAAAAFFYLLHKQAENHKEEKTLMRKEHRTNIANIIEIMQNRRLDEMDRRLDRIDRKLSIPPEEQE